MTVHRLPHHPSSENLMLESPPKVPAGTFSVPTVPVEHRSRDRIGPNTYRRPTPPHLRWPDCTFSPIHGLSGPRAPINHRRDPAVTQSLAIPPVVGPWQAYTRSYRRPSDRVPPAGQAHRNTQPMHHCTDPCSWSRHCPARCSAGFGGVSCYSTGHSTQQFSPYHSQVKGMSQRACPGPCRGGLIHTDAPPPTTSTPACRWHPLYTTQCGGEEPTVLPGAMCPPHTSVNR